MSDYQRHLVSRAYNLLRARGLRPSTISYLCSSRADLARSRRAADLLGAIADRAAREL